MVNFIRDEVRSAGTILMFIDGRPSPPVPPHAIAHVPETVVWIIDDPDEEVLLVITSEHVATVEIGDTIPYLGAPRDGVSTAYSATGRRIDTDAGIPVGTPVRLRATHPASTRHAGEWGVVAQSSASDVIIRIGACVHDADIVDVERRETIPADAVECVADVVDAPSTDFFGANVRLHPNHPQYAEFRGKAGTIYDRSLSTFYVGFGGHTVRASRNQLVSVDPVRVQIRLGANVLWADAAPESTILAGETVFYSPSTRRVYLAP